MKPAPFEYLAPTTLDEALAALATYGEEAKVLAGGQSLVPLMNFRLARPRVLIDINRLAELAYIHQEQDGLRFGALTRQAEAEASPLVRAASPLLAQALRFVGHAAIRSRGTIGGSIAHADPAAELPLLLVALDGYVRARRVGGERTIAAQEFFVDYLTTALAPTELLTEVCLPASSLWDGASFLELARRHGDYALVASVVLLRLAADGTCAEARIALAGVGPTPLRIPAAEAVLVGTGLDAARQEAAAQLAAEAIDPPSDIHGSADYRRRLARTLVQRGLAAAVRMATTGKTATGGER
ncbi:MAG TPA: xanthine dehydrogenase family protein subunit M [Chloroflexota bacterium]|nr:xanthine dehydrogenase family protein subunit M [Chloroflexota bacterium]